MLKIEVVSVAPDENGADELGLNMKLPVGLAPEIVVDDVVEDAVVVDGPTGIGQLGERLDCPASAITENVVEEHLLLRSAPPTLRHDLRDLFLLCNQARYAPVRGTSELNSVAAKFEKTVGELQEVKA